MNLLATDIPCHCDVLIVGAGVAGASSAYHLSQSSTCNNIVVIDTGMAGNGSSAPIYPRTYSVGNSVAETRFDCANRSGSTTMTNTNTVKMMLQIYPASCKEFLKFHGERGVHLYLKMAKIGMQWQKDLAKKVFDPSEYERNLQQCGSLYVADELDMGELREEFVNLQRLGGQYIDIEWWDHEKLLQTPGVPSQFVCAIYFPHDATIDSAAYSRCLLQAAVQSGKVRVFQNAPAVTRTFTHTRNVPATSYGESPTTVSSAITELSTGARIVSDHVVLCTGGLYSDPTLAGILKPCWSYLVSVPHPVAERSDCGSVLPGAGAGIPYNSPNFFTWNFTYDWRWVEGRCRVSGEDGYSALKPPQARQRCESLLEWVAEQWPEVCSVDRLTTEKGAVAPPGKILPSFEAAYGVYSETPDAVSVI